MIDKFKDMIEELLSDKNYKRDFFGNKVNYYFLANGNKIFLSYNRSSLIDPDRYSINLFNITNDELKNIVFNMDVDMDKLTGRLKDEICSIVRNNEAVK